MCPNIAAMMRLSKCSLSNMCMLSSSTAVNPAGSGHVPKNGNASSEQRAELHAAFSALCMLLRSSCGMGPGMSMSSIPLCARSLHRKLPWWTC